jgi:PAS domain S-box-containing protein
MPAALKEAHSPPPAPARDGPPKTVPAAESGRTILLVDDDRGLLRLIEKALQRENFATATAASGREAVRWLTKKNADLVLLDLKLPDMEGHEVIEQVAKSGRGVPFIIITGQGDERVAVEMMKRGAMDYLVKDAQFLEFVAAVVRRAIRQLDRDHKLARAEEELRRIKGNLAKAQEIAHLGSYEINLPWSASDYWSEEAMRMLGLDPARPEIATTEFFHRVIHPDDRARVQAALDEAIEEKAPLALEHRILLPDGSIRHLHSLGEPVCDASGQVVQLVGTLMDVTERKRLEREILEISDYEKQNLGQDLHDGLCQQLAGIELMSQVLEQTIEDRCPREAARAGEIAQHVREAIGQTRLLARGLSPVMLEAEGLMAALQEFAVNTESLFNVECRFHCQPPVLIHDHATATHLFRIAQEAVSNAVKHGRAGRIGIHLDLQGKKVLLRIVDNGIGIPRLTPDHRGMGLRTMQYRAGMIGGTLIVERADGSGTEVRCSVPITPPGGSKLKSR